MCHDIIDNIIPIFAVAARRTKMMTTIKTACLPKLICELTKSVHQYQLSEMERSLLNLIRYAIFTSYLYLLPFSMTILLRRESGSVYIK